MVAVILAKLTQRVSSVKRLGGWGWGGGDLFFKCEMCTIYLFVNVSEVWSFQSA